jgi:hypothetical protein
METTTSNEATQTLNLYQRLLGVQSSVDYLRKDQQGDRFQYVSSSQAIGAIREAMNAFGLVLAVRVDAHTLLTKWGHGDIKVDVKEHMTELDVTFTWVNSDNPEEKLECPFYGQGLDTGEKGVGKALTYAEKYFILKFFHIPTDKDDPDAFQERTEAARPKVPTIGDAGMQRMGGYAAKIAEAVGRDRKDVWADLLAHVRAGYGKQRVAELTDAEAQACKAWLDKLVGPDVFGDDAADAGSAEQLGTGSGDAE